MKLRTLAFVFVLGSEAAAQLPSASAPALGLGDNYTALARGYAAVAWNPAMLGIDDNPRTSLAFLPVRLIAGLDPVTLGDITEFEDQFLPEAVREEWLNQIENEGSEQGTGGGDVTWLAVQMGRFAAQLSTTALAVSNLTPHAAEVFLFGNYGRTGTPRALQLDGSDVSSMGVSTLALSYGRPLAPGLALGATLKYTLGHGLLHGEDRGTAFTENATAEINFPVISTSSPKVSGGGAGIGLDVGFAMVRGTWTFGAVVQNVFNTFGWDEDELVFRAGLATFDIDTHESDFVEQSFANAPAHLQQFIADAGFKPQLAVGLAYVANSRLTVVSDFRQRLGDSSIELTPDTHLGVGAEYLAHARVPLRAGVAYVEGGYQIAGGAGVDFGPVSIAASLARRDTDLGVDTIVMVTLISTTSR